MIFFISSAKDLKSIAEVKRLEFPKTFITFLLMLLFALAFILTDYWNIPKDPIIRTGLLAFSIILTAVWSMLAAGSLKMHISWRKLASLVPLLIASLLLNFRQLVSVIPWRGDESHHIEKALTLVNRLPWQAFLIGLISAGVILFLSWRKPRWAAGAAVLLLILMLSRYQPGNPLSTLRYPYLNNWFIALAPELVSTFNTPYHEILFRILPFLSAVALAWLFQCDISKHDIPLKLLWGLAVVMIPSVLYYSSITYLEMPAVVLMTIVCLRIEPLVSWNSQDVRKEIGWYALILLGFIKETTLPFILMCLVFRYGVILTRRIKASQINLSDDLPSHWFVLNRKAVFGELSIGFAALVPITYYVILRTLFSPTRGFSLHVSNLLNPVDYLVLGRSFIDEFGAFLPLFLFGCYHILRKSNKLKFSFYMLIVLGYSMVYLLDEKLYIGYSRFNLFYLPPILAGSHELIKFLTQKWKTAAYALAVVALVVSLLLSPINLDGTKKPYWGNYLFNTSEHYYPVDQALLWQKNTNPDASLLISGLYSYYPFQFYFEKFNWQPSQYDVLYTDFENQDDTSNLQSALEEADHQGYGMVLFFQLGEMTPSVPPGSHYHFEGSFSNQSHTLLFYSK